MKISIITVTHNAESTIECCIKSVIDQNYRELEYILIDGLSNDGTSSIIKNYKSFVSSFISENDQGIYDAMNKGIRLAKGEIVGFLNSDDFYTNKNVLSSVAKIFTENPSIEACFSDLLYVSKNNSSKIIRFWKSSPFKKGLFAKGWCPPHTTFFVRRSVYEKYGGFDLDYKISADFELMLRFLEVYNIKSKYVPKTWVTMRMGGTTNKSLKNIWKQNKEVVQALSRNKLSYNIISFFLNKIIFRGIQFFQRTIN